MLYISCTFNDFSLKITIIRLMHMFSNQRHVIYCLNPKSLFLCFKIFFIFLIYKMTSINSALAVFFFIYLTHDLKRLTGPHSRYLSHKLQNFSQ